MNKCSFLSTDLTSLKNNKAELIADFVLLPANATTAAKDRRKCQSCRHHMIVYQCAKRLISQHIS
jgi:hypothetical protein